MNVPKHTNTSHTLTKHTQNTHKTPGEHSGNLRASETCAKHKEGRGVFIGPKSSRCPAKGHTFGGSCPAVQRLPRMSRY
jgi:hypothetical protein